ncbi:serine recombinase [Micromonospora arborensis]|uniref:Serine recombinase n=1 Tax=Micromonospora arborensis TaxID=2116518 RepID=A0A318NPB3_9ACTN|nr:recombinase family protein [Micromonospora arborensis]PYC75207.1 serine recombinase [Micromonospora arborensis]
MADVDALSYARASQDRTGEELSVGRQHEDHRTLAQLRQARIVRELTDNDVSAAGKRRRPDFETGLELVRRGEARVIIATDMSRLTRGKARDEVRLLELGLETGLHLWFVRAPDLDLSTAAGRLTASILIAAARHEIEQKSERQRRAAIQAAEQGRRIGGRRPFGYESDGVTIRESEAAAVRDAYEAVLAGVPLGRIAADWNARGLNTPQPKRDGSPSPWTAQTLRPTLLNPRYAGLRSHVTEALRETMDPRAARLKAIVGPAAWEELVTEETWRAAVELITDPSRHTGPRSGRGLLTGVGRCGVPECGATVHRGAAPARKGREGHPTYRCRASMGHVGRASEPVDWWVTEVVIGRLERPDAALLLADDKRPDAAKLRREARALRVRLDSLAGLLADGVLTEVGVRRESVKLRTKLAEVEAAQADAGRVNVLGPLINAPDVRAAVEALDTDRLRVVIDTLMTVTLLPPGRGVRFGQDVESWERVAERISASIVIDWR